MTPSIKTVVANGLRFAYLEEGTGPLVLLVHGFPDTPHTWDAVRPALASAGFRAVSPFTRGYLPTEIPADGVYDMATLGKDVAALIEALGERSAIVVGHDWGAMAAYAAAINDPDKVRFLITVAIPHPGSLRPTPSTLWSARHFFSLRRKRAAAKIRKGDFAMIDHLVSRWSPAWDVPAGETDAAKATLREPGCLEASLGYYRAMTVRQPGWMRKKVDVPAAVFAGEHDNIKTTAYDRAAKWYTRSYEVVKMPGGHFMHREHPDRFLSDLVRLVKAVPA